MRFLFHLYSENIGMRLFKHKVLALLLLLGVAVLATGCRTTQGRVADSNGGEGGDSDSAPPPSPDVTLLSIRGYLAYRSRTQGKRFSWRLRFYRRSGLVMGTSNDRDGRAEFFGIYSPRSGRFFMTKFFKYRRSGRRRFYYRGMIRGRRLRGTAHVGGYFGTRYAGWAGRVSFGRMRYTHGKPRRFVLRGLLRYGSGRSKSFLWGLRYFPSSGMCYGSVKDKDGRASFSGVYDRATNRFFLRKRYSDGRTFYYSGRMTRNGADGNARTKSFINRRVYASWRAKMVWRAR
jgi:hypothetical protein